MRVCTCLASTTEGVFPRCPVHTDIADLTKRIEALEKELASHAACCKMYWQPNPYFPNHKKPPSYPGDDLDAPTVGDDPNAPVVTS